MAFSNIRYGCGVTKEVGYDLINMKASNVLLMTDKNVCISFSTSLHFTSIKISSIFLCMLVCWYK